MTFQEFIQLINADAHIDISATIEHGGYNIPSIIS